LRAFPVCPLGIDLNTVITLGKGEIHKRGSKVAEQPPSHLAEAAINREAASVDAAKNSDYPMPFPRHLPHPSNTQVRRRAMKIGRLLTRHFGPMAYRKTRKQEIAPGSYARPLRLMFEELGATFVKFGQLMGSSSGVFGEEVSNEFRSCLDAGPSVPFDEVRRAVETEIGRSLEDVFASFDPIPVGQASIAVVHKAILKDGREAAVKVLRPNIEQIVSTDLDLLDPLIGFIARQMGATAGPMVQVLDGFREQIAEELDLRNEARAMTHFGKILREVDLPKMTVPVVYEEYSGMRVLTMEFFDGVPIDDLTEIERMGFDPKPVVEQCVRGWFLTAVRFGAFHGDVHAGNLMMRTDGRLGVLDWGIVGRLDSFGLQFFRQILQAALGDESAWLDIANFMIDIYGSAMSPDMNDEEKVKLVRTMMEPALTRPFGEVSLGEMLAAVQEQIAVAHGVESSERKVRDIYRRWRAARKFPEHTQEEFGLGTEFHRNSMLLAKQLMYFERYGKIYMSDTPLLHDKEFFAELLEY